MSNFYTQECEFKPIPGFEHEYAINKNGRVLSLLTDQINNTSVDTNGYLMTNLYKDGKRYAKRVHILVAQTFIPNPDNLPEVNHKDECKTNNCVDNLEWCDHKYNNNYGSKRFQTRGEKNPQNKFTEEMIRDIKQNYIPYDKNFGAKAFQEKYGISLTHVCSIANGRRWGYLE